MPAAVTNVKIWIKATLVVMLISVAKIRQNGNNILSLITMVTMVINIKTAGYVDKIKVGLCFILIVLLLSCGSGKQNEIKTQSTEGPDQKNAEALIMEKAKPAYTKAFTEINEIKSLVKLAEDGLLKQDEVIRKYNNTVGQTMGQLHKLTDVKMRIDTAGDAYIKYKWNIEAAKIAREMAAEKAFELEKQQ